MRNNILLAGVISDKTLANKIFETVSKVYTDLTVTFFKNFNSMKKESDFTFIDYLLIDMNSEYDNFKEIFTNLKEENPYIIRILIVDNFSEYSIMAYHNLVHFIVEKKYLVEYIKDLFIKASQLKYILQNEHLIKVLNSFDLNPVIKGPYFEILQQIQRYDVSLKNVGTLVEKDLMLSTKVLQVSNMTINPRINRITSVKLAVVNLGINILRALILSISFFSPEKDLYKSMKYVIQVEYHSLEVAKLALLIAKELNVSQNISNDAYTAGLLHDLGRIVIMHRVENWKSIRDEADNHGNPVWISEKEIIGATHMEIGAYFLSIYGFPPSLVDVINYHHYPRSCNDKNSIVLAITHVAEAMHHRDKIAEEEMFLKHLDLEYLEKMGIKEKILLFYKKYSGIMLGNDE